MTSTFGLAFLTVVMTLAYLGIAILGSGGFATFFSHPARIVLAIVFVVLSGAALFSSGNLSPGEREDRANRWVIAAFGLIGLLMAFLPAYTDRKGVWTLDGDTVRWVGGSAVWSPSSLGISWSRAASTASSVIQAIWDCSSIRWAGLSPFARVSACCSRHS